MIHAEMQNALEALEAVDKTLDSIIRVSEHGYSETHNMQFVVILSYAQAAKERIENLT